MAEERFELGAGDCGAPGEGTAGMTAKRDGEVPLLVVGDVVQKGRAGEAVGGSFPLGGKQTTDPRQEQRARRRMTQRRRRLPRAYNNDPRLQALSLHIARLSFI